MGDKRVGSNLNACHASAARNCNKEIFQHCINGIDKRLHNESSCFTSGRSVRRLALVSPWAGGNLGDSAIISALISNISTRIPVVEFVGITLNLEETRRRFGIEGFPLAAASSRDHGPVNAGDPGNPERQKSWRRQIKQWLKRMPLLGDFLKLLRTWSREIAHIAAATRIVRRLDGIIVAGGGALDEFWGGSWGHPWSLVKWSVISRIYRVPFLFVSVGKCSLERPASRLLVRIALKLAAYRSYRDPDSKNAVQELINSRNDPVFPDLAFSHPLPVLQFTRRAEQPGDRLIVGLSPIAYCDPRVWPLKDGQRYDAYIRQLANIAKWLLKEGHQLLLFATGGPDLETINDLLTGIADTPNHSAAIRALPGPFEQSINSHLEGIGQADLIVASRLHGVILSHLVAIPVLALSYDPKVDAQMTIAKQKDYCLDINALELNKFIERFKALKGARIREAAHLRSDALLFREQLNSQYDRIFGVELQSNNRTAVRIEATDPPSAELS